jgi:ATP-binding cassette subfamily C protein
MGIDPTLPTLLAFVVAAITTKAVLLFFAHRQVGFTVAGVVRDFRLDMMRSLLEARWGYFVRRSPGQFANAIATEASRSAMAYKQACAALAALFQMGAYLAVALMLSWTIALGALIAGAILTLLAQRFFSMTRSSGKRTTRSARALSAKLVDVLQGVKALKAMGREGLVWPLLEGQTESLNRASRQEVVAAQALASMQEPILTVMLAVGLYALIGISGLPFSSVLVMAFVFYRLVVHVNTLQTRYQTIILGESAFFAFRKELRAAREHRESWTGTRQSSDIVREIRLEDICFSYGDTKVLDGIDAVFPAHALTSIHGESGAGKTTLGDLLVGLQRPTQGTIFIDDVPLEELDIDSWRQRLGYVPQEMLLFDGSIFDNVTLGDPRYSREDAQRALELAGAWDFVNSKPEGLDEPIGNRGAMLSGGQRQRLALARALVGSPTLLILDEVTSGLDPETEARICTTLTKLSQSMTIVSISHREALSEIADVVYNLKDGRIDTSEVKRTASV